MTIIRPGKSMKPIARTCAPTAVRYSTVSHRARRNVGIAALVLIGLAVLAGWLCR